MRQRPSMNIDFEALERSSRAELRALWTQELGDKPPQSLGRDVLALGIAYARQERLFGGLTKPVARELDRLFAHALADVGFADVKVSTARRSWSLRSSDRRRGASIRRSFSHSHARGHGCASYDSAITPTPPKSRNTSVCVTPTCVDCCDLPFSPPTSSRQSSKGANHAH